MVRPTGFEPMTYSSGGYRSGFSQCSRVSSSSPRKERKRLGQLDLQTSSDA